MSRCDVKVEIKCASKQQMEDMFVRFYPDDSDLKSSFSSRLPPFEIRFINAYSEL
jgi:hypothetical protein